MSDLSKQKEQLWLSAVREIGFHFNKIGDIMMRCAADTETLTQVELNASSRAYVSLQKSQTDPPPRGEDPHFTLKRTSSHEPGRAPPASSFKPPPPLPRYNPASSSATPPKYTGLPKEYRSRAASAPGDPDLKPEHTQEDDDEMLSVGFRARKRAAHMSALDVRSRSSGEDRAAASPYYMSARSRGSRPMKRVRMNWSDAENVVFFNTIRRHATDDDNTVLQKIVIALDTTRTLIQCKGHFRNMLTVGKVTQTDTEPRRWVVVDDPVEPKRLSMGKTFLTDAKRGRSSGMSGEDPATGEGGGVGQGKGQRSEERGPSSQHQEKGEEEEDEDVDLDDLDDDDERDKDYQDEPAMDEEDGDEDENDSGTNNTAVRVTDVGDIDPGGTAADFENPTLGASLKSREDITGKSTSAPLKKQPGGRVGDVAGAHSIEDKKSGVH